MTENDNKLLEQFFADNRHEIADNGFTRRIMHRLPERSRRLSQIWTVCCFAVAFALFVSMDGIKLILNTLRETFDMILQSGVSEIDPKSLLIAAIVLIFLACKKITSLA